MPDEHDEFLMWVGICVTEWARIEEQLFHLCEKALNTRVERAAIVYYRTPTIDARLKLVDELVRSVLPKRERKVGGHDHPDLKEWNALQNEITDLLSTRRRIAHHPVAAYIETVGRRLGELEAKTWLEIYVSDAERLRERASDMVPLKQDDLVQHTMKVQAAVTRLAKFLRETLPKHS
jgi:hypothetical protein